MDDTMGLDEATYGKAMSANMKSMQPTGTSAFSRPNWQKMTQAGVPLLLMASMLGKKKKGKDSGQDAMMAMMMMQMMNQQKGVGGLPSLPKP